jgi:hypothetical protein
VEALAPDDLDRPDAHRLKDRIARVLLLPTLALAARGEEVWKSDSFERARERWNDLEWEAVEIASRMRRDWGPVPNLARWIVPWAGLGLGGLAGRVVVRLARDRARHGTPLPSPHARREFLDAARGYAASLRLAVLGGGTMPDTHPEEPSR